MRSHCVLAVVGMGLLGAQGCLSRIPPSPRTGTAEPLPTTTNYTPSPPNPTRTAFPWQLPTPTPSSYPGSVAVPTWVLDFNAQVLLVAEDGFPGPTSTIWLVNPALQEVAGITIPSPLLDTDWTRIDGRLFLQNTEPCGTDTPAPTTWRLDLSTGTAETHPRQECPTTLEFPQGQYVVIVDPDQPTTTVRLFDTRVGTSVELVDPFSGQYPDWADTLWTKAQDLIAVLRWREPEYGWPLFWYDLPITSLAVYTPDGRLYRTFEGVYAQEWAPDNSHRMLHYIGGGWHDWYPCILDVDDGSDTCAQEIRQWREAQDVFASYFTWTPDAQSISFSYSSTRTSQTGICIYSIASHQITCPVTEGMLPLGYLIWNHEWSPHGDYIVFTIDSLETGDLHLDPHIVTAAADGANIRVWDFHNITLLWRPDP